MTRIQTRLHQSLRIVARPLLEAPPLRKPPKSWEMRNSSNATVNVGNDALSRHFAMLELEPLEQPSDEVILERAFD